MFVGLMMLAPVACAVPTPPVSTKVEVKKGDVATVPGWSWVVAVNAEPIENGNVTYEYGMSCGISYGSSLSVVGIDKNQVLVEYHVEGSQFGSACPNGIQFFIDKATFGGMTAEYQRVTEEAHQMRDLVKRLNAGQ